MKHRLICLFTLALAISTQVFSASQSAINTYEKNFNFDWNNYSTIEPNKAKIAATEAFLKTIPKNATLSTADRASLGKLLYKLGTFYTHVSHEPDIAIEKLNRAGSLLTNKQDKAWNDNHLAYAYEQKFAASGHDADKETALDYTHKVITNMYPEAKSKEAAFAYCVIGLVKNDSKKYKQAEISYKTALTIYESLLDGKDDQYARAKNRLANIILDQNGRDQEALAMLEQLKKYWLAKENISHDPYAARNFISLGQAYLKVGNTKAAHAEFENAITIYKNVYGKNSAMLAKANELAHLSV